MRSQKVYPLHAAFLKYKQRWNSLGKTFRILHDELEIDDGTWIVYSPSDVREMQSFSLSDHICMSVDLFFRHQKSFPLKQTGRAALRDSGLIVSRLHSPLYAPSHSSFGEFVRFYAQTTADADADAAASLRVLRTAADQRFSKMTRSNSFPLSEKQGVAKADEKNEQSAASTHTYPTIDVWLLQEGASYAVLFTRKKLGIVQSRVRRVSANGVTEDIDIPKSILDASRPDLVSSENTQNQALFSPSRIQRYVSVLENRKRLRSAVVPKVSSSASETVSSNDEISKEEQPVTSSRVETSVSTQSVDKGELDPDLGIIFPTPSPVPDVDVLNRNSTESVLRESSILPDISSTFLSRSSPSYFAERFRGSSRRFRPWRKEHSSLQFLTPSYTKRERRLIFPSDSLLFSQPIRDVVESSSPERKRHIRHSELDLSSTLPRLHFGKEEHSNPLAQTIPPPRRMLNLENRLLNETNVSITRSTSEIDHLLGKLLGSLSDDTIHLALQDKNLLFTLAGQVGLSVSAVRDRLSYLQSN